MSPDRYNQLVGVRIGIFVFTCRTEKTKERTSRKIRPKQRHQRDQHISHLRVSESGLTGSRWRSQWLEPFRRGSHVDDVLTPCALKFGVVMFQTLSLFLPAYLLLLQCQQQSNESCMLYWTREHKSLPYGWRCGPVVGTSVFGWRTLPDLRLIYGWHVTTLWVKCLQWVKPPRTTQPFILSGSINE